MPTPIAPTVPGSGTAVSVPLVKLNVLLSALAASWPEIVTVMGALVSTPAGAVKSNVAVLPPPNRLST